MSSNFSESFLRKLDKEERTEIYKENFNKIKYEETKFTEYLYLLGKEIIREEDPKMWEILDDLYIASKNYINFHENSEKIKTNEIINKISDIDYEKFFNNIELYEDFLINEINKLSKEGAIYNNEEIIKEKFEAISEINEISNEILYKASEIKKYLEAIGDRILILAKDELKGKRTLYYIDEKDIEELKEKIQEFYEIEEEFIKEFEYIFSLQHSNVYKEMYV